jgi:hypothetical protein
LWGILKSVAYADNPHYLETKTEYSGSRLQRSATGIATSFQKFVLKTSGISNGEGRHFEHIL